MSDQPSARTRITRLVGAAAIAGALAFLPIVACSRGSDAEAGGGPPAAKASGSGPAPAGGPGAVSSASPSAGALEPAPIDAQVTPLENPAAVQRIAAEAQRLGKDPAALLARVNRVRFEIYPGVFRGAAATLADNAGNDYDRAVLLHDLLLAADPGARVRYAFCTLSPPQSAAAVTAARSAYVSPAIAATADALAAKAPNPNLQQGFARISAFWKQAAAHEREEKTQLAADFQKAGAQLTASAPPDQQAVAADHVWVQLLTGHWIDLDPSVPQAKPGASVCPTAAKTSDAMPDAAFDIVSAALRLESRDGSQARDATIASGAWRAADLATATLMFAFAEPSGLHSPSPQPAGMRSYTPLLIAGSQKIAAVPIVVPAPVKGLPGNAASGAVAGAAAAFGDAQASPAAPAAPPGPVPIALRLDVAVAAPNAAPVLVERDIFDRVSAADRAAGRAATVPPGPLSPLPFGTVWNVAVNLGTGLVGAGDSTKLDPNSEDPAALVRALGMMHRGYYALRRALFAETAASPAPAVVTIRPGVSFLGLAPQPAGVTSFGLALDRAYEGASPFGGDAAATLAWAVASVYGERLAIATPGMMAGVDHLDQLPFDDVIEMFYIARHSGNAPALVGSSADLGALPVSADAKVRLAASLTGGASAVVTSAPVSYGGAKEFGWWIVSRGAVTDEMQSGMHQALPGYAAEVKEDSEEAIVFRRQGFIVRCAGLAAGAVMAISAAQGGEGSKEIAEMAAEQFGAIREANEAEEMREAALKCAK